jgi:hypothetical protein
MDQAMVDWAITAIDFGEDTARAEQWFKVVGSAYQSPEDSGPVGGWDDFVARLYPAAEQEGFDSATVQYFVEALQQAASDPIADVVQPLYEQQDSLPQEYLNLHGANAEANADEAGPPAQAEAASEEQEWYWDEAQQLWHHLEDNEWVPQSQNGYVLNHDRTEWVALEAADESSDEAEPAELTEPQAAEAEVVADALVEEIEEAVESIDGLELGDISDEEFEQLLERLVGTPEQA